MRDVSIGDVATVCGACVGGLLGYFGFVLLLDRGLYALVLPAVRDKLLQHMPSILVYVPEPDLQTGRYSMSRT